MEQHHPFNNLKNDPRLKNLAPERVDILLTFAGELANASQDEKMSTFMAVHKKAAEKQIHFSAEERDLLLSVLTEKMSPEEKKKVALIQSLASRLNRT